MSELTTLPGQIMHSATADKLVQPQGTAQAAEAQGEEEAQKMIDERRRTVPQTERTEGKRVRNEEHPHQRHEEEGQGKERRSGEGAEEDAGPKTKRHLVDVVV